MPASTLAVSAALPDPAGNTRLRIITAKIGPIEQSATRPKLSALAFSSLRMDATPTPSAIINGTVIGPVVTPPESNAIESISRSITNAPTKIRI